MSSFTIFSIVIVAAVVLIFMNYSAWSPVKWIGWALGNVVIGSLLLFLVNLFGESFAFTIPLNPVTATIAGFLGIPGLVTLILIKQFIL
ncbi:pro-sigmaK processing inhibitor BofA family protein [Aneurinibacillus terranovensis]|uniref:pro-sigmaK processing inhibitor BofA family protein n=1 Tax=Aneurinibacillus terranovensis TaxID=278991 RepID=UPI000411776D|nr:pro-sigmaK processing inhibitor BofA family protein [Aneurinibacillus terranovensis]